MSRNRAGKLERLAQAVEHHYRKLKVLRDRREQFLSAAAGSLYPHADKADSMNDILNLMRQAAEAQTLSLAANRPRILATATTVERQAFAEHYQNALNAYIKTMRVEEALQECARNAFYSLGIAKVYMAEATAVEIEADEWMDPGKPFIQSISPDHFCYDTDATDFRHCSFLADRYRVRFEDVLEDTRFPAKVRKSLRERGPQRLDNSAEQEWGEPLGDGGFDPSQFEEFVYLCDAFLPKDGVIITYICDEQFRFISEPLAELEWDGSEMGPYRILNLGPVPDKTTPSSPAQNLLLQHNLVNSLYRKLEEQAIRQKILTLGGVEDEGDLTKVRDAGDGEFVTLNNPQAVDQLRLDGPDQPVFGFALNAMEQFSKQAGNLDHKLGLSATADTATQQSMIGQNVSRMEAFYQGQFVSFVREVIQELGRLLFADATTQIPMVKQIPGTDFVVDAPWMGAVHEGARLGEFRDYDLDIEPQSMPYRSAVDRLREIDAQVQMLVPLVPLMVQQGKMINLDWWLKTRAKYSDIPEMQQLVMDIPPPQPGQEGPGGSHERTLAGGQGGEYIHRNVSEGGQAGPDPMQLMSAPQGGE